jgi:mRNA-degrading endonuclease RelE of RelBE toxin-antitoxin system
MNYKIELSANFKKEAKRLTKKYPSLKSELAELFTKLEENPTIGTPQTGASLCLVPYSYIFPYQPLYT